MRRCTIGCGLTKTEQLRQTKASARLREIEKKQDALAQCQPDPFAVRRRVMQPDPKRVDFKRPAQTKAQLARVKRAEEVRRELERKQEAERGRPIRRTPAPVAGDARLGRERPKSLDRRRARTPGPSPTRYSPVRAGPSRPCTPVTPKAPSKTPTKTPKRTLKTPKKTTELAKAINADIIHAEPVSPGPITNVVIPPGVVNDKRTTIVSIPQPTTPPVSPSAANRSLKLINKSLNEQDAVESQTVQDKLSDLQQARRDFVLTVAGVGNKSVNILEEIAPEWVTKTPSPPRRERYTYQVPPDIDDDYLRLEHGLDHPDVVAAREFLQKMTAQREQRDAARRMDDEFDRIAAVDQLEGLDLDIPVEEELYLDKDISWQEDDAGMAMPIPSRVKAFTEDIPAARSYSHEPFDPDELERFFDLERYPPSPECDPCSRPPRGREALNPDLWELEDPWYIQAPCPAMEAPDLIEFDLIDFD